jgi:predicted ATPase
LAAPERVFQLGEAEFGPLSSLYRTNLPVPPTPFLGRARELVEVVAMLRREGVRLVTLTGPGGAGKTRLALQAAAEAAEAFPGGVWWVPLGGLRDSALEFGAVAQALGLREQPEPLAQTVADALVEKRTLVLLDNVEHLLPGAAREVAALVASATTAMLLLTSRERLRLAAEHAWGVPPPDCRARV